MVPEKLTWFAEAEAHLAAGRPEPAEACCLARLAVTPQDPLALSLLSFVRIAQGRADEAEILLRAACVLHPESASLHATLGNVYLMRGKLREAVGPLQSCVLLDATAHEQRAKLVAVYEMLRFAEFSDAAKGAMLRCLADDALNHNLMRKAWLSLVRLDPQSAPLLAALAGARSFETFRGHATDAVMQAWQGHALLNRGLERFVVADAELERGLTFARRWFFERALAGRRAPHAPAGSSALEGFLPLLCTLARACFFCEYVLAVDEDLADLREAASTAEDAALLGCYQRLSEQPDARRLATLSSERDYQELVRIQIHEPLKEKKIEATISTLAPIADAVSRAVRAQYEESPYPRWVTVGGIAIPAAVAAEARGKSILIAGCGTGREAVETALIFPAARIDALDLSRTSLAYGIRKAREIGTANLFFLQGDILELARLRKRFDLIVSSGVLHHMDDPLAGLRACLGALRPAGLLKLSLYSRLARSEITAARAWVARAGFPATLPGIRAFRAAVMALPEDDPVRSRLIAWEDFYSASGCRDLAFHVREHTFTLPELTDIIHALGLAVVQVETRNAAHRATYRERFPDDPSATNLLNWHLLEQEHPSMFAGMYTLWLCRANEVYAVDLDWLEHTQRM
jgi:SAM-dependent methyltransferase/tetratricopeptide (TPR) repeat protein